MNRKEAISHIRYLSLGVAGEFCVGREEEEELAAETNAALRALGCSEQELGLWATD